MADPFAPGLLARLTAPPRRVALLRASRIGDFICATPAFRALRHALSGAEITIVTLPMLRDLAERLPHFDCYAPFPGYPGLAEQLFDPRRTLAFFREMQARHFDLAIQMQGSGVNANPFMLMLGAQVTAGFVRPGDPAGRLDAALPLPESGSEIQRVLALATFLGAPPHGERTEFPLRPEDTERARHLLSGATAPLIAIHPDARDPTRRWSAERFGQVGRELQRRYGGTVVVVGDAESELVAATVTNLAGGRCRNLAGRTSLPVLGALLRQSAMLITNDTGPAHIAYALDVPTVVIWGSGELARYGPPPAAPVRVVSPAGLSGDGAAVTLISVEQVLEAAAEVIRLSAPGAQELDSG